jgi:two-component system, LytTR family, sensor kinase
MIKLPEYTKHDLSIFISIMTPAIIVLNVLFFGSAYFKDVSIFILATLITGITLSASWVLHTWVAVTLRNRFSGEKESAKRITIAILLFMIMTSLTLSLLFWGYNSFTFLQYELNEKTYEWALIGGALANVFVTFLHEGVWSFEKWKTTLKETEQLKKEYMHSQVIGLKSQVNPHFLFNSLNSLSSLIHENQQEAEKFLDEMSKVYRYLLRSSDEQLVSLDAELNFIRSYFYMLKVRYSGAVHLTINVDPAMHEKQLPPLTLQIMMESVFNLNTVSKEYPLSIEISTLKDGWLQMKNNIQKKIGDNSDNIGIENIRNKFRLLCQACIRIADEQEIRTIEVPLMNLAETTVTA